MTFWSSHFQYYMSFISITGCCRLLDNMNTMCLECFFCLTTIVDCWKWQVCNAFCNFFLAGSQKSLASETRREKFLRSSDCLFSIFCSRRPYLHPSSQITAYSLSVFRPLRPIYILSKRGVMGVWGGVSPGDQWRLTDHINQSSSLWLTLSRSPLCLSVCLHITVSRLQDFNNQAHPSFPHITWELLITEAQRNVLKL